MITKPPMPQCAAFAKDIREHFGEDERTTAFGTRLKYAEENGRVWGVKGEEGVVPNLEEPKK